MKKTFVDKLVCPFDKHELELQIFAEDSEGNILEGMLTCTHCKRYYPIVYGLPIMTPDEYREPALEAPLLKKWEKQLASKKYEGFRLME
ncbi:MAG: Trm112 family protein [Cyclobacteriaceae bacterium]